jgi:hypothetical protein
METKVYFFTDSKTEVEYKMEYTNAKEYPEVIPQQTLNSVELKKHFRTLNIRNKRFEKLHALYREINRIVDDLGDLYHDISYLSDVTLENFDVPKVNIDYIKNQLGNTKFLFTEYYNAFIISQEHINNLIENYNKPKGKKK